MVLLFLPAYFTFLNPIKEVFGWLKSYVKKGQPEDAEDLFDLLELGQHDLLGELVERFYTHVDSFIPACLNSQPIRKIYLIYQSLIFWGYFRINMILI